MVSHFFPECFFDLTSFKHRLLFQERPVWLALKEVERFFDFAKLGQIECDIPKSVTLVNPQLISIGKGTHIQPGAYLEGPCWIGKDCEVRHLAFVRAHTLIGDGCVIGHATEVKKAIFLNGAKAPHFNYVGDSILGNRVNLGAGVICANYRLDQEEITVNWGQEKVKTNLKKLGAIIGDDTFIGCNAVLNPGLILKKNSKVGPLKSVLGTHLRKERLYS